MDQKSPLAISKHPRIVIYDRDGTLQTLLTYAYALTKKDGNSNLTLDEFKEQIKKECHVEDTGKTAMIPGMAGLVCYTSSIAENILMSGGDPKEVCPQLKNLIDYFITWHVNGEEIEWGLTPDKMHKKNALVAHAVVESLMPHQIAVVGDDTDDYTLARHLYIFLKDFWSKKDPSIKPSVIFLRRGNPEESVPNSEVPVYAVESVNQMKNLINDFFGIRSNQKTISQGARPQQSL